MCCSRSSLSNNQCVKRERVPVHSLLNKHDEDCILTSICIKSC